MFLHRNGYITTLATTASNNKHVAAVKQLHLSTRSPAIEITNITRNTSVVTNITRTVPIVITLWIWRQWWLPVVPALHYSNTASLGINEGDSGELKIPGYVHHRRLMWEKHIRSPAPRASKNMDPLMKDFGCSAHRTASFFCATTTGKPHHGFMCCW